MRRSLQSFIVALLCLTLGIDSAKACWLWRHRCRPATSRPSACQPAAVRPADECLVHAPQVDWTAVPSEAAVPASCCGSERAEVVLAATEEGTIATDNCGRRVECCHTAEAGVAGGDPEAVAATSVVPAIESGVTETVTAPAGDAASVVVHEPTVVVDSAAASPKAAPATAQPLLPVLEPAPASVVKPASGEQPAVEPPAVARDDKPVDKSAEPLVMPTQPAPADEAAAAAPVTPAPAAALAVAPPPRPNLFDLYSEADEAAREGGTDAASPEEPAAVAEPAEAAPAAEPAMKKEAPAGEEAKPAEEATEPAETPTPPPVEPATPAADAEESKTAEPADEDAAPESSAEAAADTTARAVPAEPQRLWTDASGSHRTHGWLVAVDAETVRILKANGRHTTVALDNLSAADRDYVADVAARLVAAETQEPPGSNATAGL